MREVSQKQFYEKIGPLNVAGRIANGTWPYTLELYLQQSYDRTVVAKRVGEKVGPFEVARYFIE